MATFSIRSSKANIIKRFIEENSQGAEEIGNHVLGFSLIQTDRNICVVLIPKNASTSISSGLISSREGDWHPHIFLKDCDSSTRYVVVLRDPVDRFISALNMFLTTGKPLYDNLPLINKHRIITEDCHFQPQHKFFNMLPMEQIDFFMYKKTVIEDIENYYNIQFNKSATNENVGSKFVSAVDETLIKTLYAEDYELINSVKFINI